ncbi:MAG: purine phosphoribosyltransferase family protein, partial [Phycisphaerae bacterium]
GVGPLRQPGKLPRSVHGVDYALEYGTDRLEIHSDAIGQGRKVVVVDDLLATGGTLEACCELVKKCGAEIVGIAVLIELPKLKGRDKVVKYGEVHSVLQY